MLTMDKVDNQEKMENLRLSPQTYKKATSKESYVITLMFTKIIATKCMPWAFLLLKCVLDVTHSKETTNLINKCE